MTRYESPETVRFGVPWETTPCTLSQLASLSSQEFERLENTAFQHAAAPEAYDIISSSGALLRSPCGCGAASVHEDGRHWHVAGGIVAPTELKPQFVQWLKQSCEAQKRTLAVYSVSAEDVVTYQQAGFAVNKFGEELVIDLKNWNWSGHQFEWVRRQTNFCVREGLVVEEILQPRLPEMFNDLTEIIDDDLSERVYSRPLRLLEGEFDPRRMYRRRLFVARDSRTQKVEGFMSASPMHGGTVWSFETYRKRRTAPRGTIPFLFRRVIDQLQQEGVSRVSLCLVPGRGVGTDLNKVSDARVRWMLDLWYRRLNFLFNTAGQDFFKSRFRPRYEERFLCVYPRNSLRSLISFLNTTGAIKPHWGNLWRQLFARRAA